MTSRLVGYARASTSEQQNSIDSQQAAISSHIDRNEDLRLVGMYSENVGAGEQPALTLAIDELRGGRADGLIAARLDRLGRSTIAIADLIAEFNENGWMLVVLDPFVDTATPYGKAFLQMAAVFAELERDLIRQRTSEGIKAAFERLRAEGKSTGNHGVRMIPGWVEDMIVEMHLDGLTNRQIAEELTNLRIPTAKGGGSWAQSTVQVVIARFLDSS